MTTPNPAAMFGTASTATAQAQLETPVHKYPLPGERREYTPNTQWGKYILPHPETGNRANSPAPPPVCTPLTTPRG